ncbi:hypothetical protein ISS05_00375 [Candidatus Woesearchaeota archaeon]|nr:hypothetical protein [Candidatus Woesearchaeota archaeon]
MDHFENFQGFAPERMYESYCNKDIITTARDILKQYAGKEVWVKYDLNRPDGLVNIKRDIKLSPEDKLIERLLKGVKTDRIIIEFYKDDPEPYIESYILQHLQIGNQSVTRIEPS